MPLFKQTLLLFILTVLLSGCASSQSPSQWRIERYEKLIAVNDNIYVRHPALSPDGRQVVFDVHTEFMDKKGGHRSREILALYDLQEQSIEYLKPHNPLLRWHSASFDRTGQYLTFISQCLQLACNSKERGAHVSILNLKDRSFRQITDGRDKIRRWGYLLEMAKAQKTDKIIRSSGINRGFPIFSNNGKILYYVVSVSGTGSGTFSEQYRPQYHFRKIEVGDDNCASGCDDELLMKMDPGAVLFEGDGRIADLGNGRVIFPGFLARGNKTKELENLGPFAFYFDEKKEELSVALDYEDIPKDPKLGPTELNPYVRSLMASEDGRTLAFIHGFQNSVALWEDDTLIPVLSAQDVGVKGEAFGFSALSADGNWLVVFPNNKNTEARQENFWLINLRTMERQEMPLRPLLRPDFPNRKRPKK